MCDLPPVIGKAAALFFSFPFFLMAASIVHRVSTGPRPGGARRCLTAPPQLLLGVISASAFLSDHLSVCNLVIIPTSACVCMFAGHTHTHTEAAGGNGYFPQL